MCDASAICTYLFEQRRETHFRRRIYRWCHELLHKAGVHVEDRDNAVVQELDAGTQKDYATDFVGSKRTYPQTEIHP
ncbi:hypothetical protein CEXT_556971 [Caerostris extrusa]|uniref:Uncharacterized protein n=1 Tax=Caerostris extrusa TaxID=172846 RepID=A0AAV4NPF6_CAEEX|nr:hypothetical protein CEXT_556971 [Caerostris extrusa]